MIPCLVNPPIGALPKGPFKPTPHNPPLTAPGNIPPNPSFKKPLTPPTPANDRMGLAVTYLAAGRRRFGNSHAKRGNFEPTCTSAPAAILKI